MGLLNPNWDKKSAAEGFKIALLEWERRIREYELGSARAFPHELKVATVCAHAPEIYTDCLRLGAPAFKDDYKEMLGYIRDYEATGKTYSCTGVVGGSSPMEVDRVGRIE